MVVLAVEGQTLTSSILGVKIMSANVNVISIGNGNVKEVYRIVAKETGREKGQNGIGGPIGRKVAVIEIAIGDDRDQENGANALAVEIGSVRVAAKSVMIIPWVVQILPKVRPEMNAGEKRTDERSVIGIRIVAKKKIETVRDHAAVDLAIVVTKTRKGIVETTLEKMGVIKFVLKKNHQMIMSIPLRRSMMKNIISTILTTSNTNPKKHHIISKLKNTSSVVVFHDLDISL